MPDGAVSAEVRAKPEMKSELRFQSCRQCAQCGNARSHLSHSAETMQRVGAFESTEYALSNRRMYVLGSDDVSRMSCLRKVLCQGRWTARRLSSTSRTLSRSQCPLINANLAHSTPARNDRSRLITGPSATGASHNPIGARRPSTVSDVQCRQEANGR